MEGRVKGPSQKQAEAPEETGQKAGELLLAVLEELKASREESAALRQLLARVLASFSRSQETPAPEEGEAEQEPGGTSSASRRLNRPSGPIAIEFIDRRDRSTRSRQE